MSDPSLDRSAAQASGRRGRIRARVLAAHRSTLVSLAVCGYLFGASLTWSFVTPIGGVPDEPAHISYAAGVVRGDLGQRVDITGHPWYTSLIVVTVPEWIASITPPGRSQNLFTPCYAFYTDRTANCAPRLSRSVEPIAVPTTVSNYPPPYYAFVGLPTLFMAGEPAVYAMRALSSVLAVGLIGLGLAVASPSRRTWLALGAAVAFTPLAAHIAGSINPSGMEIAAAMGLGIGLIGIVGGERRNGWKLAWPIVALAFGVAWARPLTVATLAAVVAAAVVLNATELLSWLKRRTTRYTVILGIATAAATAMAFRNIVGGQTARSSLGVFDVGGSEFVALPPNTSVDQILHGFERQFLTLAQDLIGNLGWLDHAPPVSVVATWGLLAALLVVLAFAFGRRWDRIGLMVVTIGALVLAPLYVMITVFGSADGFQARYHLPLATLIILGAVVILSRSSDERDRRRSWVALRSGVMVVPILMLVSLAASLFRYSVGASGGRGDAVQLADMWDLLFGFHEWLPPTAALIGLITLAAGGVALMRVTRDGPHDHPTPGH